MNLLQRSVAITVACALSGCASNTAWRDKQPTAGPNRYSELELEDLLRFGSDFANKTPEAQAEECKAMLKRDEEAPDTGLQLHLLIGRSISNACGDAAKVLESVAAIPANSYPDERVQWLVDMESESLKRANELSKKPAAPEGKKKSGPGVSEAQREELRVCKEKLEAIRSMEKRMDQNR